MSDSGEAIFALRRLCTPTAKGDRLTFPGGQSSTKYLLDFYLSLIYVSSRTWDGFGDGAAGWQKLRKCPVQFCSAELEQSGDENG